jgi:hypothetical protein
MAGPSPGAACGADGAAISNIFRLAPDQVRIVEIPSDALPRVPAVEAADGDVSALARAVVAEQRRVLQVASAPEDFVGRVGAAAVSNAAPRCRAFARRNRPATAPLVA